MATRLCLDRLRAARARRETYVGPWLPEPLIEDLAEDPLERAEDVSVAFLLALQRLSPLERAVFLLHDVFDADYAARRRRPWAATRPPAASSPAAPARICKEARPRFSVPQAEAARLAAAFHGRRRAATTAAALAELLAEDCVLITDGGGKRKAALRPLVGRDDIVRLLRGPRLAPGLAAARRRAPGAHQRLSRRDRRGGRRRSRPSPSNQTRTAASPPSTSSATRTS